MAIEELFKRASQSARGPHRFPPATPGGGSPLFSFTMSDDNISWSDVTFYHGDTDDSDTNPPYSPRTALHRLRCERLARRTLARTIFNWSVLTFRTLGGQAELLDPFRGPNMGRMWVRFRARAQQILDNRQLVPRLTVYTDP